VVLDEVHERGMDSDFALALLMLAMAERKNLKLILIVRFLGMYFDCLPNFRIMCLCALYLPLFPLRNYFVKSPQSATIQTEHFAAYLGKWLNTSNVPVLFIPGFTYPVVEFYKGDFEEAVRGFRDFTPGAGESTSLL